MKKNIYKILIFQYIFSSYLVNNFLQNTNQLFYLILTAYKQIIQKKLIQIKEIILSFLNDIDCIINKKYIKQFQPQQYENFITQIETCLLINNKLHQNQNILLIAQQNPSQMRLSFVQRLRNQKHQTVPTRQSQQKQILSPSIKIKSHSLKHKPQQLNQHCNDIKMLLSILEQSKNPQNQLNINPKTIKTKTQQKVQFYHNDQQKNENKKQNLKNNRPSSAISYKKQIKSPIQSIQKRIDQNSYLDLDTKLQQKNFKTNQQPSLYSNHCITNVSPNKMIPYRFPNKKNSHKFSLLPPINNTNKKQSVQIKYIENKRQQIILQKVPTTINLNLQKKRGLQNIGNTCYINSIAQCLFHLSSFNNFFLNRQYFKDHKFQKQKFNSDRSIVEKYRQLYLYVIKGQGSQNQNKKSTYSLKLALSKGCSLFLDWQQQDAHEFMRKLLDAMHQEINRCDTPSPYRLLKTRTKLQYSSISNLADQYFQYYKQKDNSYIYDCFGGQIFNKIQCVNCQNQSISFQNCLDICLPLVKGKTKLNQLMQEFFGSQKLCDYYTCQYCRQTNKHSIKTTKFWRTPDILIIQLKRSQFGKKNQQPITFPIDVLSLQNYINDENDKIAQKYANYTLKSVVCHRGVIQGGHYWSIIKQFGQWYEIDDQKVNKIQFNALKQQFEATGSSDAYILFYESMSR